MVRIPGSHVPNIKNRSSKHLIPLTKVKPAVRSMSNAMLEEIAKGDGKHRCRVAEAELERRRKNFDKNEVRRERARAKAAEKKAAKAGKQ